MLAGHNRNRGEVTVNGKHVVAVVQLHLAAIPGAHRRPCYIAFGCGAHRRPVGRVDVDAGVEGAFPVERVHALPEARSHAALDRPNRRRIRQLRPVAGKAGRQASLQRARNPAGKRLRAQGIKLIDGEHDLLLIHVIRKGQGRGRGRRGGAGGGRGHG